MTKATETFKSQIATFNAGPRRPTVEDLASAPPTLTSAFMTGNAKGFDGLAKRKLLRSLSLREISQDQLELVAQMGWLEELKVYGYRGNDATALTRLASLRRLSFEWAPKLRDVAAFGRMKKLDTLVIGDFKAIDDFEPLQALTRLRALSISGPNTGKQACRSVEPLGGLTSLQELWLAGVLVAGEALFPLARLRNLRRLLLPNWYPVREFARLSVALPDTECELFAPVTSLAGKFEVYNPQTGAFDVDESIGTLMLTGKPARLLKPGSSATDAALAKRTAEFEAWQAHYRGISDPAADKRTSLPIAEKPNGGQLRR